MNITIPHDIFQITGMSEAELQEQIAVMLYNPEKLTLFIPNNQQPPQLQRGASKESLPKESLPNNK
ncbi:MULTISPECIES: hypothetical protein [Planktothricoides]|uniref:Uncharacterized protein n=2 Tax=Planktothricoides raciborskii TaxID=132608 RepID=A0AAU8JKS4_9CYAN|nr:MULTISPECIES: hypothetical protein [Planktothricoides]KOR36933.1 hypothetical protein AM228_10205 [Planktothricoides sp. SR001]MBD2546246.1 hypothetical protein [Planktothricoides raciborskii FACHB-1370]MBD2584521.1 hypothetical protein [Planktothricoides raciborskii FACHB-1261]